MPRTIFSHLGTVTSVSFKIVRIGPVLRYVEPLYEKRLDNDTKKFRNWLLWYTTRFFASTQTVKYIAAESRVPASQT